jgi:hypothetical protein
MAATIEHPESYGWWINELESLGVTDAKRFDELDNDKAELKDIAENTKEMMLQQYEIAYGRQEIERAIRDNEGYRGI